MPFAIICFLATLQGARFVGFRAPGGWTTRYYSKSLWDTPKAEAVLKKIEQSEQASGYELIRLHRFACLVNVGFNRLIFEDRQTMPVVNSLNKERKMITFLKHWYAYEENDAAIDYRPGKLNELRTWCIIRNTSLHSNRENIRLANQIHGPSNKLPSVEIAITDYVSFLMTDALYFVEVNNVPCGGLYPLCDGLSHFCDADRGLLPLCSSSTANILGVSTIAFTNDNILIILLQTSRNQFSQNEYIPTGSGSIDSKDALLCDDPDDLLCIVKAGGVREMREELGIPEKVRCYIQPYAFTRLLHRGGIDFFCTGWIDADFASINRWKLRGSESRYTNKFPEVTKKAAERKLNLATGLSEQLFNIRTSIVAHAKEEKLSVSYQLLHGLMLLEDACRSPKGEQAFHRIFREKEECFKGAEMF